MDNKNISANRIIDNSAEKWRITTEGEYMKSFVRNLLSSGYLKSDVDEIVNNSIKQKNQQQEL